MGNWYPGALTPGCTQVFACADESSRTKQKPIKPKLK